MNWRSARMFIGANIYRRVAATKCGLYVWLCVKFVGVSVSVWYVWVWACLVSVCICSAYMGMSNGYVWCVYEVCDDECMCMCMCGVCMCVSVCFNLL